MQITLRERYLYTGFPECFIDREIQITYDTQAAIDI
jgi:hypothetical protein